MASYSEMHIEHYPLSLNIQNEKVDLNYGVQRFILFRKHGFGQS